MNADFLKAIAVNVKRVIQVTESKVAGSIRVPASMALKKLQGEPVGCQDTPLKMRGQINGAFLGAQAIVAVLDQIDIVSLGTLRAMGIVQHARRIQRRQCRIPQAADDISLPDQPLDGGQVICDIRVA